MVALSFNPLESVKKLVQRWFEYYKEMGDEMAVEMFFDDLEIVEHYVRALFDQGVIDGDEYWRFLNYCEELLEELKKIAGIERIDMRFW